MNRIGYLVGSHVIYNYRALPILLDSMISLNKIEPSRIFVIVNGAWKEKHCVENGVNFFYRQREFVSHFVPLLNLELGSRFGYDHWFYLNCTSRCGPRFKELVETGFDPNADATLAGDLLPLGASGGTEGRAINDLAMYRYQYLMDGRDKINSMDNMGSWDGICNWEGVLYAHAPKQSRYPRIDHSVTGPSDVYGTGTMRITEYYPGIDWYRFKKNWGQLTPGTFDAATL